MNTEFINYPALVIIIAGLGLVLFIISWLIANMRENEKKR